ncbi:hypothetical protein Tco_0038325, partial [Tanacetum coccineum]
MPISKLKIIRRGFILWRLHFRILSMLCSGSLDMYHFEVEELICNNSNYVICDSTCLGTSSVLVVGGRHNVAQADQLLHHEVEGRVDELVKEVEELENQRGELVDELMNKMVKEVVE